jgi:hypothetical protein
MLNSKSYLKLTKIIFFIVGLAHLVRLLMGWRMAIGGWDIPQWVSVVGLVAAWYIAYNAYLLGKKK